MTWFLERILAQRLLYTCASNYLFPSPGWSSRFSVLWPCQRERPWGIDVGEVAESLSGWVQRQEAAQLPSPFSPHELPLSSLHPYASLQFILRVYTTEPQHQQDTPPSPLPHSLPLLFCSAWQTESVWGVQWKRSRAACWQGSWVYRGLATNRAGTPSHCNTGWHC